MPIIGTTACQRGDHTTLPWHPDRRGKTVVGWMDRRHWSVTVGRHLTWSREVMSLWCLKPSSAHMQLTLITIWHKQFAIPTKLPSSVSLACQPCRTGVNYGNDIFSTETQLINRIFSQYFVCVFILCVFIYCPVNSFLCLFCYHVYWWNKASFIIITLTKARRTFWNKIETKHWNSL